MKISIKILAYYIILYYLCSAKDKERQCRQFGKSLFYTMANPRWSHAENLAALKLFADFKKSGVKPSANDPKVQKLAASIGREVFALMMRLGNYEYFHSNGLHGLKNGGTNLRLFYETTFPTLQ